MVRSNHFIAILISTLLLSACGPSLGYRSARTLPQGDWAFAATVDYQAIAILAEPDQYIEGEDDDRALVTDAVVNQSEVWVPTFHASVGLNADWEAGGSIGIDLSNQLFLRRHLSKAKGMMPETAFGLKSKFYPGGIVVGDPAYYSSVHEVSMPVYFSWDRGLWEFYSVLEPTQATYSITPASLCYYCIEETRTENAMRVSLGMLKHPFAIEISYLPLPEGLQQSAFGIGYLW